MSGKKTFSEIKKEIRLNLDGWVNILTNLGKRGKDKTESTHFEASTLLDDAELSLLWLGDGLGKKIVSVVPDDMTRNGIAIPADTSGKILEELKRLKAWEIMNTALKWARLYRGAIVIMGFEDGLELSQPVAAAKREIKWLKCYPASRTALDVSKIVQDPKSKYFEDVEIFTIMRLDGTPIEVHASRCIIFKGEPVPPMPGIGIENRYWGISILQAIWDGLRSFGATNKSIANLMMEVVIGKYKLSNLAQLIAENNTTALYARMEIINASKSLINGVMLGENEDYIRDALNFAGVSDVWDRLALNVCAASEIPMTKLFGRSPAGLNSTGDADLRMYYDMVASKQETMLRGPLQLIVDIINASIKAAASPVIEFNPVWEPTQAELTEMELKEAQTYQIYIETGVLTPEAVSEMQFPELSADDDSEEEIE